MYTHIHLYIYVVSSFFSAHTIYFKCLHTNELDASSIKCMAIGFSHSVFPHPEHNRKKGTGSVCVFTPLYSESYIGTILLVRKCTAMPIYMLLRHFCADIRANFIHICTNDGSELV